MRLPSEHCIILGSNRRTLDKHTSLSSCLLALFTYAMNYPSSFRERFQKYFGEGTLSSILRIYPICVTILQYLSAYDIAKLQMLLLCNLSRVERDKYLSPVRDLIWDIPEMKELYREGMRLVLLGHDVPALEQRLHDTKRYLKLHGTKKLNIYLFGTFPVLHTETRVIDRLIKFSMTGYFCPMRLACDKYQLRQIQWASGLARDIPFLMAFGTPMRLSDKATRGLWYKVSDIPDQTIELRVYVPTFSDRLWGQVRITHLDVLQKSKASRLVLDTMSEYRIPRLFCQEFRSLAQKLTVLHQVVATCIGSSTIQRAYLTANGVRIPENKATSLGQLLDAEDITPGLPLSGRVVSQTIQAPKIGFFLEFSFYYRSYLVITLV